MMRGHAYPDDPFARFLLFAEGDESGSGTSGEGEDAGSGDGEGKGEDAGAKGRGQEAATKSAGDGKGEETTGWLESIPDQKLRDHAGRFASPTELTKAHLDLRRELSKAIAPLPKDASDEQLAAYRKATGVPKGAEDYPLEMPEGMDASDDDKAFHVAASKKFHNLNVTAAQAKGVMAWWNEMKGAGEKALVQADKDYAEETAAELRREWPGAEFEKNREFGNRAVAALFGDKLADTQNIETKDGKFVLDHPNFVRVFAQLGREMESRGPLIPMSDGERLTAGETATELRKKAQEAHAKGDFGEANRLSEEERRLYEARDGNQPIVGAAGRAA